MKLIIKTIKNETFPIEIDPESTVNLYLSLFI